jgi:hypothetical protein
MEKQTIHLFKLFVLLMIIAGLYSSCKKQEQYPITPVIEFKDYILLKSKDTLDSIVVFTLSFKDGDGDIGYPDEDSTNKSIFVYYYKKIGGVFKLLISPDMSQDSNFNAKIPMILSPGVKRPLKGEIDYSIDITKDPPKFKYDTIYVKFYLMDRALNMSNKVSSPEIVLQRKKK